MNIVIIGAGQVGSSLASNLSTEDNDIVVIDSSTERLRHLREQLDIDTCYGNGAHPAVQEDANVGQADMLVAVTSSDEVNMLACQVAYQLHHTPTRIARVRSSSYLDHAELFSRDAIPVDVCISPERLITDHIHRLIANPGALQVLEFADGKAQFMAIKVVPGAKLIGHQLKELPDHLPDADVRVIAIYREGSILLPDSDTSLEQGDEIFVIASTQHIRILMSELSMVEKPYRHIMIAGGGNIGSGLAAMLETERHQVKILESDMQRAGYLAETLDKTLVLDGDASDEFLLQEEDIAGMDLFCAVTNDDEVNVLSAMLAKKLGARKVMALVNRQSYVDLVEGVTIDLAISPQQITLGGILAHVRQGDVVAVHSIRRGIAEVLQIRTHGDRDTSRVVGRAVTALKLPPGVVVCGLLRGEGEQQEMLLNNDGLVIEERDEVVLFVSDKRFMPALEKMFQVGMHFV